MAPDSMFAVLVSVIGDHPASPRSGVTFVAGLVTLLHHAPSKAQVLRYTSNPAGQQ
jgi:hypothetical protein